MTAEDISAAAGAAPLHDYVTAVIAQQVDAALLERALDLGPLAADLGRVEADLLERALTHRS